MRFSVISIFLLVSIHATIAMHCTAMQCNAMQCNCNALQCIANDKGIGKFPENFKIRKTRRTKRPHNRRKWKRQRQQRRRQRTTSQICPFGAEAPTDFNLESFLDYAKESIIPFNLCLLGYGSIRVIPPSGQLGFQGRKKTTRSIDLPKMVRMLVEHFFPWVELEYSESFEGFAHQSFENESSDISSMFLESAVDNLVKAATKQEPKPLPSRRRSLKRRLQRRSTKNIRRARTVMTEGN